MIAEARTPNDPPSRVERTIARVAIAALALGVLGLALWIPFRRHGTLLGLLTETPGGTYAAACQKKSATYLDDVRERRYLPQQLRVRRWNSPGQEVGSLVGETLYASMLTRRATPFSVVVARGGLGKSKLAAAIEARTCDAIATFRIDVGLDLLPRLKAGEAPVEAFESVIARSAHLPEGADGHVRLAELLFTDPWLLLVDSLDEVAISDRPAVAAALEQLYARYPTTLRLAIFTRPPVYSSNYGLTSVHSWMSIEPLSCDDADERLRFVLGDEGATAPFRAFAAATGLDARSRTAEACRYVHLATFRDLFVAIDVARDAAFQAPQGFTPTRASMYGAWVDGRLRKAGLDPAAVRPLLHALVEAARPAIGTRTFDFDAAGCAHAAEALALADPAATCAALAGSALAKRLDEGHFRFDNQSVADYFLAVWADNRLGGVLGGADCGVVAGLGSLFESNEVAGFLLGMPNGARCASAVVETLCAGGEATEELQAVVEQGVGVTAAAIAAALEGGAAGSAHAECTRAVAARLRTPVRGTP